MKNNYNTENTELLIYKFLELLTKNGHTIQQATKWLTQYYSVSLNDNRDGFYRRQRFVQKLQELCNDDNIIDKLKKPDNKTSEKVDELYDLVMCRINKDDTRKDISKIIREYLKLEFVQTGESLGDYSGYHKLTDKSLEETVEKILDVFRNNA